MIVATSSAQDPNTIVDLLSFPYIFRGALDVRASRISLGMMLAAARALAELAREEVTEEVSRAYGNATFTFGPEYLLPKPIDPRILVRESRAVAAQAVAEGLALAPDGPGGLRGRPHRPPGNRARDDAARSSSRPGSTGVAWCCRRGPRRPPCAPAAS